MKLLLIDGHYYVYRSYFAILHLSNSRGEPTNAIFGFTKSLRLMLKHLQPDLGAVVWDAGSAAAPDGIAARLQRNAQGNAAADGPAARLHSKTHPARSASRTSRCRTRKRMI